MTKEQIYQREYQIKYRLNNKDKVKEYCKEYYVNNTEKIKEYAKEYHLNNKDKKKEKSREYYLNNKDKKKEYYLNNKDKINKYNLKWKLHKKANNSLFKLECNIRSNILSSIKRMGYTKKSKTYQILGCSFEEFKEHLEKQFTKEMNWENAGDWHLDHIYPVSLAKDEEELIRLNHYTNFQPLWAIDNLKKGNKIIEQQLILI